VKPSEAVGQCVRKGYLTPDEALHIAKSGSSAVAPILWLWQLYETRFPEVGGVWGRLLPILQTIADGSVSITRSCSSYGLPPLPLAFIMSSLMTAVLIPCLTSLAPVRMLLTPSFFVPRLCCVDVVQFDLLLIMN